MRVGVLVRVAARVRVAVPAVVRFLTFCVVVVARGAAVVRATTDAAGAVVVAARFTTPALRLLESEERLTTPEPLAEALRDVATDPILSER